MSFATAFRFRITAAYVTLLTCVVLQGCGGGGQNDVRPFVDTATTVNVSASPSPSPSVSTSPSPAPSGSPSPAVSPSPGASPLPSPSPATSPSPAASPSPSPSPAIVPRFIYALGGDASILTYAVDVTSGKARSSGKVHNTNTNTACLVVNNNFLYTAGDAITAFAVDASSGALTPTAGAPLPGGFPRATAMAVAPSGRTLYILSGANLVIYDITPVSGALTFNRATSVGTSAAAMIAVGGRLYVSDPAADAVVGLIINADGTVTPAPGSPYPTAVGDQPRVLTADPAGKNLYVSLSGPATLAAFTINADGSLTANGAPVASGPVQAAVVTLDGKYVYVANYANPTTTVTGFTIRSNGTLAANSSTSVSKAIQNALARIDPHIVMTTTTTSTTSTSFTPCFMALDPAGTGLLVSSGTATTVTVQVTVQNVTVGMVIIATNTNTNTNVNTGGPDKLDAYAINLDGSLTLKPGAVMQDTAQYGQFVITSGAQKVNFTTGFAYVSNTQANTVSAFSVAANGALTPIGTAPTGAQPGAMAVATVPGGTSPSGKFLFVANRGDDSISVFPIGLDGVLGTGIQTSPGEGGVNSPAGIVVDPTGRFVYTANSFIAPSNVSGLNIGTDGTLTSTAPLVSTTVNGADNIAMDPGGTTIFVTHDQPSNANSLVQMQINRATNVVETTNKTNQTPAVFGGLGNPVGAAFHASGQRLFIVNSSGTGNDFSEFPFDGTLGTLITGITNPPSTGSALATDPLGLLLYVASGATINQFTLSQDGNVTPVANGSVVSAGGAVTGLAFDYSNRFVFAVSPGTNSVAAFVINGSGQLTPNPLTPTVPAGNGCAHIVTTGSNQ